VIELGIIIGQQDAVRDQQDLRRRIVFDPHPPRPAQIDAPEGEALALGELLEARLHRGDAVEVALDPRDVGLVGIGELRGLCVLRKRDARGGEAERGGAQKTGPGAQHAAAVELNGLRPQCLHAHLAGDPVRLTMARDIVRCLSLCHVPRHHVPATAARSIKPLQSCHFEGANAPCRTVHEAH
jgi:hypothetical protein